MRKISPEMIAFAIHLTNNQTRKQHDNSQTKTKPSVEDSCTDEVSKPKGQNSTFRKNGR